MSEWEPATEAEAAMRDALRIGDQEQYFQILARADLLLPVVADALAGNAPSGWGTWSAEGRTHVLAFTSPEALTACLAEHAGSYRRVPFYELAADWPDLEWWLGVNPGLPIEGYLPAWFVAQVSRGDVRLPGRTLGARARMEQAAAMRSRTGAQAPPESRSEMHASRSEMHAEQQHELRREPDVAGPARASAERSRPDRLASGPLARGVGVPIGRRFAGDEAPDHGGAGSTASELESAGLADPRLVEPDRTFVDSRWSVERPGRTSEDRLTGDRVSDDRLFENGDRADGDRSLADSNQPLGARTAAGVAAVRGATPGVFPGAGAPTGVDRVDGVRSVEGAASAAGTASSVGLDRAAGVPGRHADDDADLGYPAPGYATPGYAAPDYVAPDYAAPDYATPRYAASDYATPGHAAPDHATPGHAAPGYRDTDYNLDTDYNRDTDYTDSRYSDLDYAASGYAHPGRTEPDYADMADRAAVSPLPGAGTDGTADGTRAPADDFYAHPTEEALNAFTPANRVEENLLDAAGEGSTDSFLSTLLLAKVLVPGPQDDPIGNIDQWHTEEIDGQPYVVVFTSSELLEQHLGEGTVASWIKFTRLIHAWPNESLSFAVNPGTPIGATLPGGQIVALASWADDVGLTDAQPEPEPQTPEPDSSRRGAQQPAAGPVVMQKTISADQIQYYLERGYDRISGFVHRAGEVSHLKTPAELYTSLGLGYSGSPFKPDDTEVYVLRWTAYRGNLYRIPYGGQHESAMHAMQGWVIERAPFRGNGFAPSDGRDVIAEFKVDSVRLPHGAQLWRVDRDGNEKLIAMFDADGPRWQRVGEE